MNTTETELLSTKEAAQYLGITLGTLNVWRCDNRYNIPFLKVGRLVKYRKSDLVKWLDMQTRNPIG